MFVDSVPEKMRAAPEKFGKSYVFWEKSASLHVIYQEKRAQAISLNVHIWLNKRFLMIYR